MGDAPASRRGRRRWIVLGLGGVALAIAGIALVQWITRPPRESRVSAALAVLDYQCQGLDSLLSTASRGPLVRPDPMLFVIDESVVRDLLLAALPFERVVSDRYLITVNSAEVKFVDGFASVRLDGDASLAGHPKSDASAEISLYGALQIVGVDPVSGVLLGQVTVFSVEARKVTLLARDAPVARLLEGLQRVQLEKFGVLLSRLQVPVQVQQVITLPRIGPEGGVSVPPLSLPLSARIEDVKAFSGRLWVTVSLDSEAPKAPAQAAATATAPAVNAASTAAPPTPDRHASLLDRGRARIRQVHLKLRVPRLRRNAPDTVGTASLLVARQHRRAALHDSLEAVIAHDPIIEHALADEGNVNIAVESQFLIRLMRRVLDTYFDRVDLSLHPRSRVHHDGELRVGTPLGKVTVGAWTVDLTVQSIAGTLRTGAPRLSVTRPDYIDVAVPVHLEKGRGTGALTFAWDSRSLTSVLCRDFTVTDQLTGRILPSDYVVHGGFHVRARGTQLVLVPDFPRERYLLKVDLVPESWDRVNAALAAQTPTERCGTLLRPAVVMERLQEIGQRGFRVALPRSIFRPIVLPAAVSETVEVEDRKMKLVVTPQQLHVGPGFFWYSARAAAHRDEPPAHPRPTGSR